MSNFPCSLTKSLMILLSTRQYTSVQHLSFRGWENVVCELGSESVNGQWSCLANSLFRHQTCAARPCVLCSSGQPGRTWLSRSAGTALRSQGVASTPKHGGRSCSPMAAAMWYWRALQRLWIPGRKVGYPELYLILFVVLFASVFPSPMIVYSLIVLGVPTK